MTQPLRNPVFSDSNVWTGYQTPLSYLSPHQIISEIWSCMTCWACSKCWYLILYYYVCSVRTLTPLHLRFHWPSLVSCPHMFIILLYNTPVCLTPRVVLLPFCTQHISIFGSSVMAYLFGEMKYIRCGFFSFFLSSFRWSKSFIVVGKVPWLFFKHLKMHDQLRTLKF